MKRLLTLCLIMGCALSTYAANLNIGQNAYSMWAENHYDYTATTNGTLTVTLPAAGISGTNIYYSWAIEGNTIEYGNFYEDTPSKSFTVQQGSHYHLLLGSSFDARFSIFTVTLQASDDNTGNQPEQTMDVNILGASWGYMDKHHLLLDAESNQYAMFLTIGIGSQIEGEVDAAAVLQTNPIIGLKQADGSHINYAITQAENLLLERENSQLLLTGTMRGYNSGHFCQFNLHIEGAYPVEQKKENDTQQGVISETSFSISDCQYDAEVGGYLIKALSGGWHYSAQLLVRPADGEPIGSVPSSGTYPVSDEDEPATCTGGRAGQSDLGLGISGSCIFALDGGNTVLPGWLLTTGSIDIVSDGQNIRIETHAQNSYGVDIEVILTRGTVVTTGINVNENANENVNVNKRIVNGTLVIERSGQMYNIRGTRL